MPTVHNFSYTGGVQTIVVPAGVEGANLICVGARGNGSANTNRGQGALIEARIEDLIPGETLYVIVGGAPPSTYVGGYPDGGNVGTSDVYRGGAGGGSTSIGRNSSADADRILVGGAGGGRSPRLTYAKGGNGGYPTGGTGGGGGGGTGGTQVAGGAITFPGSFGQGGSSPNTGSTRSGGGGGGGWYGGGAGANGSGSNPAGGGGSSYYAPTLTLINAEDNTTASNDGNGSATITFDDPQNIGFANLGPLTATGTGTSLIPRRNVPRREYIWVYGLDGDMKAVIV